MNFPSLSAGETHCKRNQREKKEVEEEIKRRWYVRERYGSRLPYLLYGYILSCYFEHSMNKKETNLDGFVNKLYQTEGFRGFL